MANYLVTGGAGFIGSAVCQRLLASGAKVATVDNLSTGFRENVPEGVEFIEGDCACKEVISQLHGKNFDGILHIAGQSSGEISFQDPVYDLQSNATSTLLLLELAQEQGCRHFVYASSMSVYGALAKLPATEESPTEPCSFYGVSKLMSEHYLRLYTGLGVPSVALRLFNVYGPGQNLDNLRQGMVSIFLAQALKEQSILVRGGGERFRDFVYIDDVVDAFCLAVKAEVPSFQTVNISSGIKTTVEELIGEMNNLLPATVPVVYEGSTAGDILGCVGEASKAGELFGWQGSTKLVEGLRRMVSAYY